MTIAGFGTGGAAFERAVKYRPVPSNKTIKLELELRESQDIQQRGPRLQTIKKLLNGELPPEKIKPGLEGFY